MNIVQRLKSVLGSFLFSNPDFWVYLIYGNFWNLRDCCIRKPNRVREHLYFSYLEKHNSWIGLHAKISTPPHFPHGMCGIFISDAAVIGRNVVMFQQVTIGSNTIKGSKKYGSPTLEDDVYIGAGAKIIGKITVGHHSRIGANAVVVKDTLPNSVTVIKGIETIVKNEMLDNTFNVDI